MQMFHFTERDIALPSKFDFSDKDFDLSMLCIIGYLAPLWRPQSSNTCQYLRKALWLRLLFKQEKWKRAIEGYLISLILRSGTPTPFPKEWQKKNKKKS